jgi:DUF4097 and DUF4098 domain-containing protein YvlB
MMLLVAVTFAAGETRREFHFTVGKKSNVSILNQYGAISVKPSGNNQVIVIAILSSDKVEVDQTQSGSRVSVLSHLLSQVTPITGRVDYDVEVPSDANVTLHSLTGPLHAEKLHGDVTLEGNTALMDVRDISDAHVHIKTLDGAVTLTNITEGHIEITSIGGNVVMNAVNGPFVQVNSNSGKINYDGDFGFGGIYSLTSHTGDIEAIAPSYASIDVTARSELGKVENDFALTPKHTPFIIKEGKAFAGTMNRAASSVKLFSISGKIHLKKR